MVQSVVAVLDVAVDQRGVWVVGGGIIESLELGEASGYRVADETSCR